MRQKLSFFIIFIFLAEYSIAAVSNNSSIEQYLALDVAAVHEKIVDAWFQASISLFRVVESEEVMHYRAAAIVAASAIAEDHDIPDYIVDNVLFTTFRKDPDFIANSINPMRCSSIWF